MRRGKHWGVILLSLLAAGYFAAPCLAVDQLAVTTRTETSDDCITVTVQLQDYIDPQDEIRGLQIDVDTSSVDLAQLHVEAPRSLIEDGSAYSNTAVWDRERGILRLNYLRFDGTLPAPVWDVMEFTLRVDPEVAQAGSVTLPVTAKFQMASGLQTTRRTECEIEYEAQTEGYVNVTIRWGALEYTYSDGIWNPQTHSYENGGWSDNGTGFVTVENQGNLPVTAQVSFAPVLSEIAGGFYADGIPLPESLYLNRNQSQTAWLLLTGQPNNTFDQKTLGTVTVTIGEE